MVNRQIGCHGEWGPESRPPVETMEEFAVAQSVQSRAVVTLSRLGMWVRRTEDNSTQSTRHESCESSRVRQIYVYICRVAQLALVELSGEAAILRASRRMPSSMPRKTM
jgi:hypothetical protein